MIELDLKKGLVINMKLKILINGILWMAAILILFGAMISVSAENMWTGVKIPSGAIDSIKIESLITGGDIQIATVVGKNGECFNYKLKKGEVIAQKKCNDVNWQ